MTGNMKRRVLMTLVLAGLWTAGASAQSAKTTLDAAAAALGAASLNSIQYSGWGSDYIFGQAYDGNSPWPRFNVPGFTIDDRLHDARLARRSAARTGRESSARRRLSAAGRRATADLGAQRRLRLGHGGPERRAAGSRARHASAVDGRMTQIWLTPHGFIKAAQAGNADRQGGDRARREEDRDLVHDADQGQARGRPQRSEPRRADRDVGRQSGPRRHED